MKIIEKLRLYLETTVFNYYFDEDRQGHEDVLKLFEAVRSGKFEIYTSDLVIRELEKAQEPKRTKMLSLIEDYKPKMLENSSKVKYLGQLYIENGIKFFYLFYTNIYDNITTILRNKTSIFDESILGKHFPLSAA